MQDACTRMFAFHTLEDAVMWALMAQHFMLICKWPKALSDLECTRTIYSARKAGRPWRKLFAGLRTTIAINEQRFTAMHKGRVRLTFLFRFVLLVLVAGR